MGISEVSSMSEVARGRKVFLKTINIIIEAIRRKSDKDMYGDNNEGSDHWSVILRVVSVGKTDITGP
jgi:hypothetical protein